MDINGFDGKDTIEIKINGLVQGVGFRPFIYRIATELGINGWVKNHSEGVIINANCTKELLELFIRNISEKAPEAAQIESINILKTITSNFADFRILKSQDDNSGITRVSPDIAVCNDCLTDLEKQLHRINYPFINCTNCGPRFTIIEDIPYDREKTSMSNFEMCNICHNEYSDVHDRRFHAQPVACLNCGPEYRLKVGKSLIFGIDNILKIVKELIIDGKIIAVKGLGGFHIACDAINDDAVNKLRNLKKRDAKPFAVMFRDIETVQQFAFVDDTELKVLCSWRRPIILLKEKKSLSPGITNGLKTIGAMLPYMPFHYLLFKQLPLPGIVMTSGNLSDEPVITNNDEAADRLGFMCDAILDYNREIINRADDSVLFCSLEQERIIRRSRGYVPNPVILNFDVNGIIATGAELKNCFCVGKNNQAILSQHIGDLKNLETYEFYNESINRFKKLFKVEPKIVVTDMHPDYLTSKYAKESGLEILSVQHHHAHIASCMAEHKLDEKVIGVALDGTGYGTDGNIWGSEFFVCDFNDFKRVCHFDYMPIPGGDRASEELWRSAVSFLYKLYKREFLKMDIPFIHNIEENKLELIIQSLEKGINIPLSCSAGRLFDAVAALTNICTKNNFEAEGPIRLESVIADNINDAYPFNSGLTIDFLPAIKNIINDILNNVSVEIISARFHNTVISAIVETVEKMKESTGIKKIILSGGTFQNRYLIEKTNLILKQKGYMVYFNSQVPSNDGGIAIGQIAIAAKRRQLLCV